MGTRGICTVNINEDFEASLQKTWRSLDFMVYGYYKDSQNTQLSVTVYLEK